MAFNTKSNQARQRPLLVWLICVFCLFSFVNVVIDFFTLFSGAGSDTPPMTDTMGGHWNFSGVFEYLFQAVTSLINLTGGIYLFLFRRVAFIYLLFGSLILPAAYLIYQGIFRGMFNAIPDGFEAEIVVVGLVFSCGMRIALLAYVKYLCWEKVLQ
jgi:hypothetical protein